MIYFCKVPMNFRIIIVIVIFLLIYSEMSSFVVFFHRIHIFRHTQIFILWYGAKKHGCFLKLGYPKNDIVFPYALLKMTQEWEDFLGSPISGNLRIWSPVWLVILPLSNLPHIPSDIVPIFPELSFHNSIESHLIWGYILIKWLYISRLYFDPIPTRCNKHHYFKTGFVCAACFTLW